MRTSIFILLICCSGCATHQYAVINSELPLTTGYNEAVLETDSLEIRYNFNGTHGPIKISLYNKLERPVYVDWKKSSVIVQGERISYWQDVTQVDLESLNSHFYWSDNLAISSGFITGSLSRAEAISFIPPKSFINTQWMGLRNNSFNLPTPTKTQRTIIREELRLYGDRYEFSKENTPLVFRSFLTLSLDESFNNPVHYDHEFWVSEVITTHAGPDVYHTRLGNQFHLKQY